VGFGKFERRVDISEDAIVEAGRAAAMAVSDSRAAIAQEEPSDITE
jgi:hypothetical protein